MLKAINETKGRLAQYRTVGEMFARDEFYADRRRNRDGKFTHSVLRDDQAREVALLFDIQRRIGNPPGLDGTGGHLYRGRLLPAPASGQRASRWRLPVRAEGETLRQACALRAILSTARKQGWNLLETLRASHAALPPCRIGGAALSLGAARLDPGGLGVTRTRGKTGRFN